jgi:hypothetical protein
MATEPAELEVRLKEREMQHKERELEYNAQMKAQELEHAERMLALETGQPLPEAYTTRIKAVGSIGTLVPIAMAAAAATASVMLFEHPLTQDGSLQMLGVVWGVCALIVLVTVWLCLRTLEGLGVWSSKSSQQSPSGSFAGKSP